MPELTITDSQPLPAPGLSIVHSATLPSDGPPQTFGEALREYGRKMNPLLMIEGLAQTADHPVEAVKGWIGQNQKIAQDAEDAFHRGDYTEAARHSVNYLLNMMPGVGSSLEEAGNKLQSGDIAGGLGDTAALGTMAALGIKGPGVLKAAARTLPRAVTAVRAGVSAAAPDLAMGAVKIGAGQALADALPAAGLESRLILSYPGAKQILSGVRQGVAAGKAALAPAAAVEDTALLDGLADQLTGRKFANLSEADQASVRALANRLDKPLPPEPPSPPQPPQPRSHYGLEDTPPPPAAAAPAPDEDFLAQYSRAVRPEDEVFREQYRRAVRPEDEVFLEQYRRAVQPGPPEETGGVLAEGTPRTNGPVRPPLAQPNPPAPVIPAPNAGGGGPLRAPLQQPIPGNAPGGILRPGDISRFAADNGISEADAAQMLRDQGFQREQNPFAGEDIKASKRAAKASRYIDALHGQIDPAGILQIPLGRLSAAQIDAGGRPGWGNIADLLGEKPPSAETIQAIYSGMRERAASSTPPANTPALPGPESSRINPNAEAAANRGTAEPSTPVPQPRQPANPVASGSPTTVRVPGTARAYQAQYAVRELDDVHASHNPNTFQKNPNYQLINDRNYADPANSERIVRQSQQFDPEYLLTDSPDAGNGAPVIDPDGNVLGGNSRTMTLQRVYQDRPQNATAYKKALIDRASQYGVNPEHVAAMKRPVLVREIPNTEWDRLSTGKQQGVTEFNQTGTAALTGAERATADARSLSGEAADWLGQQIDATGPHATLADALSGPRGAQIINRMVDEGVFTPQEKPQLLDSRTGQVTAQAKDRISKALTGQFFRDSDQFARTPPELRNKLERLVAPAMQVETKPGWGLIPEVQSAVDLLEYARAHGLKNLSDATAQDTMFGGEPQFTPRTMTLAQALRDDTATGLAKKFREYSIGSRGSMFEERTPTQVFNEVFGKP